MKREWVFINHLAKEQGLSHQRFYRVLKDAPLKRNKKGQVDRKEAMVYYEEHTQQARRRRPPETPADCTDSTDQGEEPDKARPLTYLEAQARKEAAVAALKELDLQEREGKLFPVEAGVRLITMLGLEIKGHLEAMDNRLPTRLAAETDWRKIKTLLKKEHAAILGMFERMKFQ